MCMKCACNENTNASQVDVLLLALICDGKSILENKRSQKEIKWEKKKKCKKKKYI